MVAPVSSEMQEAKAYWVRFTVIFFKQKIMFWLMLLRTKLSSLSNVFQIHLNRFDYYMRKTWMLRTVKTVL